MKNKQINKEEKFIQESNIELIIKIMNSNNGYITSRNLTDIGISREYLKIMQDKGLIEKVEFGIYLDNTKFEDSFYTFNLRFKKTIFSHMTALYFHNLAEKVPYKVYDITIPRSYNNGNINKHNIFYVNNKIINLGLIEIETPSGNKVKAYDMERSICDVIKSINRMDGELVKKCVRNYLKSNEKDLLKLSEYAEKMGIKNKVMEYVEMLYE